MSVLSEGVAMKTGCIVGFFMSVFSAMYTGCISRLFFYIGVVRRGRYVYRV